MIDVTEQINAVRRGGRHPDPRGGRGAHRHDQPDLRRRARATLWDACTSAGTHPALVPPGVRRPAARRPLPARGQRRRHDRDAATRRTSFTATWEYGGERELDRAPAHRRSGATGPGWSSQHIAHVTERRRPVGRVRPRAPSASGGTSRWSAWPRTSARAGRRSGGGSGVGRLRRRPALHHAQLDPVVRRGHRAGADPVAARAAADRTTAVYTAPPPSPEPAGDG